MSSSHENTRESIGAGVEPRASPSPSGLQQHSAAAMRNDESRPLLAAAADEPIEPPGLQMSIARRILLVVTVAGAGMLNVSGHDFLWGLIW
jgi:hypothetical protein